MIDLFRQILETVLFPADETEGLVLITEEPERPADQRDPRTEGSYWLPKGLFPNICEVHILPDGEAYLAELRSIVSQFRPPRLFITPPMVPYRGLSERLRREFPGYGLHEIALEVALENLDPGSLIGIVLPLTSFTSESSRPFRDHVSQNSTPRLFVAHHHSLQALDLNIHSQFRINTLLVEVGRQSPPILRFFRYPEVTSDSQKTEIISDLQRLLKQGGGQTRYGYVLRDGLSPGSVWLHDKYHPDVLKRQREMAHLGDVRPLGDLVEILRGLHIANDRDSLSEERDGIGIPVIEGRNIRPDGSLTFEETRYRAEVPEELCLAAGHLCLRSIIGNNPRLTVAQIKESMLPLVALNSVITLRPKPSASPQDVDVLAAYLRSEAAIEFLRAQGMGIHITPRRLLELPVPVPDEELNSALQSLNEAWLSCSPGLPVCR
jgi:hypothetical protein